MTLRKKVSAIVFDKDGDILLWKYCPDYKNRSKLDKNIQNNKRTFPWWAKEPKEKFREALYRELNEEVSIAEKNLNFVYTYTHPYYKRYPTKTKKRFGVYRQISINWKKQRFFVLFYSWKKEDTKTSNINEFCQIKRVSLEKLDQNISSKILHFLNKEKLTKIIKNYLANRD